MVATARTYAHGVGGRRRSSVSASTQSVLDKLSRSTSDACATETSSEDFLPIVTAPLAQRMVRAKIMTRRDGAPAVFSGR